MDELKKEIMNKGMIVSEQVLNLNTILNHQIDPPLIMAIGKQFASLFATSHITKVLTVEASGISIGFATASALGVPLIFARRRKTVTTDADVFCERVPSFTHGIVSDVIVSRSLLQPSDRILIVDDIIANGDMVKGLVKIVNRSAAHLAGIGIAVEKSFQSGGRDLREQGIRVESLVRIVSLTEGQIVLA